MRRTLTAAMLAAIMLSSCGTMTTLQGSRGTQYARLYDERPRSIVIMPPINNTNFAEAKEYLYTTLYVPLCEKGYYVFPPALTMEFFQTEGAYDSENFANGSLSRLGEQLGCDAAMFTTIKRWDKTALAGTTEVTIEYTLRSTHSDETLYHREGKITLDSSPQNSGGGLASALAGMLAGAIATATTDKTEVGRQCTRLVLADMPAGPYSTDCGVDSTSAATPEVLVRTIKPKD